MAPPGAERVQKQSQFSDRKGESVACAHWHLTFGSGYRLWPECDAHSYFCWAIESAWKPLDRMSLISEKEIEWMKVVYDQRLFVSSELYNTVLFLRRQIHLSGWHLLTPNGSYICFSCHLTTTITIFSQHLIKSFNLEQVLSKSNIWSVSKENKF